MIYTDSPQLYIACLAAYNERYLHGRWIDMTQPLDVIYREIDAIIASSPVADAEEWAIHDHENFGGIDISEYDDIAELAKKAQFIAEHGELGGALLAHYDDITSATAALNENYHGKWPSEAAFARELFDECYGYSIPESLRFYVDYERFADDLFFSDYLAFESQGCVHVFTCY